MSLSFGSKLHFSSNIFCKIFAGVASIIPTFLSIKIPNHFTFLNSAIHKILYTAVDNGTPSAVAYDTLTVNVYNCSSSGDPASLYFDGVDDQMI